MIEKASFSTKVSLKLDKMSKTQDDTHLKIKTNKAKFVLSPGKKNLMLIESDDETSSNNSSAPQARREAPSNQ
jgi:hypothetical protein